MVSADLGSVLPEIVVALGGVLLLLLPFSAKKIGGSALFCGGKSARLLGGATLLVLLAALNLKFLWLGKRMFSQALFYGMFVQDRMGAFFQLLILISMMLIVLLVVGYAKEEVRGKRELYALLLLAGAGLLFLVGAQHLVLVYLGLEMVSIFSYLLAGFEKHNILSIEAALKYFLFGSLATGALLYGISLIYGLTGTMDLGGLAQLFPAAMARAPLLSAIALFLVTAGFGFKVALVPFHMWAPDAYEGAPTPVAAFFSVGPKLAGFAVLVRVFLIGLTPAVTLWPELLAVLAVLTMTVGNVVALAQTNVKRLLAYSSIAHAGTMAVGLSVATPLGLTATLYYLIAYLLMNIAAFVGVIYVGNAPGGVSGAASDSRSHAAGRQDLGAFSGLSRTHPALAFMITLAFLSLAGIPPMAGFFAKFWIFAAALEAGAYWLAIIAAVNSVISLFYYLKVVKAMYMDPSPLGAPDVPRSRALALALGFCTVGLILVGLWPAFWLLLASSSLPGQLGPAGLPPL